MAVARAKRLLLRPLDRRGRVSVSENYTIKGIPLRISDGSRSYVTHSIARELEKDQYGIDSIPFQDGDVALDIGAHVGLVSIYLAKRHPGVRVLAFEPWGPNYRRLVHNLKANGVSNVKAFNEAVTGDGRAVSLVASPRNTGGVSAQQQVTQPTDEWGSAPSVTLDEVFRREGLGAVRFLKIDCEGSEHEILKASSNLHRIDYVSGEFHINSHLRSQGHSIEGLAQLVQKAIPPGHLRYVSCNMSE